MHDSWIERLFQRFEDFYGAKWAAQFGSFPRDRVKRTWAEELSGFADMPEALAEALKAQKSSPFPPTLPEFLGLCREAARRAGDRPVLAIAHKLTPEQIEKNKARIKGIAEGLSKRFANVG